MRILYDYTCFAQYVGGVSRYHVELMKNASDDVQFVLQPLLSNNVYLKEIEHPCKELLSFWKSSLKANIQKQLNQWLSIGYLHCADYDVFHTTGMNPYFAKHVEKPVVVTVHDLIHEKYPELMPDSPIIKVKRPKILKKADAIICISNQTKKDLLSFYDVDESKISVIYHGAEQSLADCNSESLIDSPYLLYVGGRSRYKNFNRFVEAFSQLDKDVHLVCTGSPLSKEEKMKLAELKIVDRTHHIFATEEQLENLYCNALAFIYPSQCEGFGLPILEAFRCGCPCVISDIECFHEVAGGAALYFDPFNIDSIKTVLQDALSSETTLNQLKCAGFERLPLFTWKETAEKHECVYRLFTSPS